MLVEKTSSVALWLEIGMVVIRGPRKGTAGSTMAQHCSGLLSEHTQTHRLTETGCSKFQGY